MTEIVLWAAVILSVGWWIPQLRRVVRRNSAVSPTAFVVSSASTGIWALWATTAGLPVIAVAEAAQSVGAALVAYRAGARWRLTLGALPVAGVLYVASVWEMFAGLAALSAAAAVRAPQLVRLFRHQSGPMDVSPGTWALSTAANVMWFTWAALTGTTVLLIGSGTAVVTSAAIAVVAQHRQLSGTDGSVIVSA